MKTTTMIKRAIISLTASAAAMTAFAVTANAYELEKHTKEEIVQAYQNMYFDIHDPVEYTEKYTDTAPFSEGDISEQDRQNTLNALNFCRYLAGLPYDVGMTDYYNDINQKAAYVSYMNKDINHYPGRPGSLYSNDPEYNDKATEIFNTGYDACGKSNLALGDFTTAQSVISYMNDTDESNLKAMGHRRWFLNPKMQNTGIGMVEQYSTMYAFDKSRSDDFTGDYIAWPPAGDMPFELINNSNYSKVGYGYTVTLGEDYRFPEFGRVKVTVTTASGMTKVFDQYSNDILNYFTINNELCGYYTLDQDRSAKGKTIIFNPGVLAADEEVTVKITGIYKKNGEEAPIEYTVKYFDLLDDSAYSYGFTQDEITVPAGTVVYLDGYNNPLATGTYKFYSDIFNQNKYEREADGLYTYIRSSQLLIKSTKERTVVMDLDNSSWTDSHKVTINFTHSHSGDEWVVDEEPTELTAGKKHRVCAECRESFGEEVIPAKSVAAAEISFIGDEHVYDGVTAANPETVVYSSGRKLIKDVHYSVVSYTENYDTCKGIVTIQGLDPYMGTATAEYDIKDERFDISGDGFTVKITNGASKKYTGSQVSVPITVQPKGEYALKEGKAYTVTIDSNYNAGEHFAKVTGIGRYKGTVEVPYTIAPAAMPKMDKLSDVTFSDTAVTFNNIVLKDRYGNILTEGVDYDLRYKNNDSVGEAKVIAIGKGNYTGESEATFNILPAPKPVVSEPEKKPEDTSSAADKNTDSSEPEKKPEQPKEVKQTATIRVDGTAPAAGTKITMIDSKGKTYDAAMNGGIFNASVPEGKYDVWVTCDGYCPKKCEVTVGSDNVDVNTDLYRFGDVDMSNEIDIADAVNIINNINGNSPLGDESLNIGDVNLDGEVDIADAVAVINEINGQSVITVDNEKAISLYVKSFNAAPDEMAAPDEEIAADEDTTSAEDSAAATESEEEHRFAGEDGKVYVICEKHNEITIKVYASESAAEPEKQYIFSKDNSMTNAPEGFEKIDEAFYKELTAKLTKIS